MSTRNLRNAFRCIALLAPAGCLAGFLAAFCANTSAQSTRADAEKDPVLKAMLEELNRSKDHLQLPGFEKPFFIEFRIEDFDSYETRAEYGATENSQHNRQRLARVTVRVGNYKTDSSGGRGDGAAHLAAIDNDPIALRSALWAAADQAYKSALDAYAGKQAALKQLQTPPQVDDFSQEKPIRSLSDPLKLDLDEDSWQQRMARISGLYRTDPAVKADQRDVQHSSASFRARVTITRLVNSEGTIVRKSASEYQESIAIGAQAPDGMRLERSHSSSGVSLHDLDSEEEFRQQTIKLITSLGDLRRAPVVEEEYQGPVLLSADASADTLEALLGNAVIATRPPLGTEARTNGPFASSFHARVLPDFLDVVDDPGLKSYNGKGLLGAYDADDQGVPEQPVNLVTEGRLENYLVGREPVRDFLQSDGHARSAPLIPPFPSIGVLKITAKNGLSDEDLYRKLLEMARKRGLKFVYYVEAMGGKLSPRLLYRITPDGKRELVRGAVLDDLDYRALRSEVAAAGKDLYLENRFGDVSATVLAPALLFNEATIRRANEKNDKLPFYPPPE
jgi:predicted Zn-dependent protease